MAQPKTADPVADADFVADADLVADADADLVAGAGSVPDADLVADADFVEGARPRPARRTSGAERRPWYYELSPLVALDMGILVLFLVAMLYLMPTGQVADASFRILELERRIAHVERENQTLRTQIAQAGDLRAIEAAARKRHGMAPARYVHFALMPDSAQQLQPPQETGVDEIRYPFSSRWDILREQLSVLAGGGATVSEEGDDAS